MLYFDVVFYDEEGGYYLTSLIYCIQIYIIYLFETQKNIVFTNSATVSYVMLYYVIFILDDDRRMMYLGTRHG